MDRTVKERDMGKIFYILGKSSTGKDTIYKKILEDKELNLKDIILYTTRPIRDGEINGKSYHFVSEEEYQDIKNAGAIIEERAYDTMHGVWRYFTAKDENIDLEKNDYLIIGVLKSFVDTRAYFGNDKVIPLYIEVEDGERLQRALNREKKPENRRFKEMCRRYLADSEDFAEEKIIEAGIKERFENIELNECIESVKNHIRKNR